MCYNSLLIDQMRSKEKKLFLFLPVPTLFSDHLDSFALKKLFFPNMVH
jgi:hypothetical protein